MKKIFSIILLLGSLQLSAQEEFVPPDARFISKVPFFQLSGGIIILKAQLDQFSDSLNFVLDTGSGGISLDSTTAEKLSIPTQQTEKSIRGIAGIKKVAFAYDHSLSMPGIQVKHLDFHINNYDLLTSVYGIRIDGIIGYSFLRRYIVHLDFDKRVMEIYTPGRFKYPKGGQLIRPNFSTLPLMQSTLQDSKTLLSRFIFDTGAGLCFLLSRDFVDDSMVFKSKRKFFLTQAEGLGGKKQMEIAVMKSIKIGNYKFKKVPVHIFEDDYNVTNYPTLGGLIGNDLLRRFNITLNYPDQSIHLKPNNHFNDPFDYSYTGLGIYLIDGQIKVVDIIEGSPGDKAGFKTDDIIFSIENNASNNIQAYKNLFQNSIGKIKVIVLRNNIPLLLNMQVKDIRK
ncbi:aspartyl protease family protein [Sediminibacterium salmoneum]|uniref:aspartyl protease family protein n=1 Tax=Sediminibacterium salmoneum TaxID=426421 RepID=UPI0004B734B4|nr:aspartyl protease family protein [Sediminibacterium salmoneum]